MKDGDMKETIPTRISGIFSTTNSTVDIAVACSQVDQN
jgi:hypothetical protein